jgi:hypothetical protein
MRKTEYNLFFLYTKFLLLWKTLTDSDMNFTAVQLKLRDVLCTVNIYRVKVNVK